MPIQCDHENDLQVENLFKKIEMDEKGQLDILVNTAFKGADAIFANPDLNFWESDPVRTWDDINGVGLRFKLFNSLGLNIQLYYFYNIGIITSVQFTLPE